MNNKTEARVSAPRAESSTLSLQVERSLLKGRQIAERYYLPEAVGIDDPESKDYDLFSHFLTQRFIRTSIYSSSFILNSAIAVAAYQMPGVDKLIRLLDWGDRLNREILGKVEEQTASYKEENYKTMEEKHHARTIELAVNDLVAMSTTETRSNSIIRFDRQKIAQWGIYWKPQVTPSRAEVLA